MATESSPCPKQKCSIAAKFTGYSSEKPWENYNYVYSPQNVKKDYDSCKTTVLSSRFTNGAPSKLNYLFYYITTALLLQSLWSNDEWFKMYNSLLPLKNVLITCGLSFSPLRHIQDPASQRLTWNKPPKSVLVIKKIQDASLLQPFKELCVFLTEVGHLYFLQWPTVCRGSLVSNYSYLHLSGLDRCVVQVH